MTTQQWAQALVDDHAWVMHVPTGVVGQVESLFDGEVRVYVSPENDRPVPGSVLALAQGHTFVATEENFVRLADHEARFYEAIQQVVAGALRELIPVGAAMAVPAPTINVLIIAALKTQAAILEAEHRRFMPTIPPLPA